MTSRPEILFLCVHNAGRSQMAAAFAREIGGEAVVVRSGGSDPAERLNPAVVAAMLEKGMDISSEAPRALTREMVVAVDVVVTMGCGDACPVFPGKRYIDWELSDPAGRSVDEVRVIRDDIEERVRHLIRTLVTPTAETEGVGERSKNGDVT